jgi:hypothetical protein
LVGETFWALQQNETEDDSENGQRLQVSHKTILSKKLTE